MTITPDNLILIGMPGSGKSTVGQLVATHLGWQFIDVDAEIEQSAGMKLWQINEIEGFAGLAQREESANCGLRCRQTVIAPGGSVVYSEVAMQHLRSLGRIVYLHVPPAVAQHRAGDLQARGVMIRDGMTFADLVAERDPLYRRWADVIIDCDALPAATITERVVDAAGM